MTTATRCCTCGDEIPPGSDVWHGDHDGETACSMLCRYKSIVETTEGWHASADASRASAYVRVLAAKEALLHDPDIFDQEGVLDVTVGGHTIATVATDVTEKTVRFEIVMGDHADEEVELTWSQIMDVVLRDA